MITPGYDPEGKVAATLLRLLEPTGGFFFSHQSFYDSRGRRIIGLPGDPQQLVPGADGSPDSPRPAVSHDHCGTRCCPDLLARQRDVNSSAWTLNSPIAGIALQRGCAVRQVTEVLRTS